jgi:hypothetical protein
LDKENLKMRKNIFLILVLVAIFAFIGAMNKSAKAVDDPIEIIKNAKTPVNLHSLAGGKICIPGISDSLVNERPSQICSWWESVYPPSTFGARYHVDNELLNAVPGLDTCDWLNLHFWHGDTAGGTVWVHVEDVMITLILTKEPAHLDTMYVEFEKSYKDVGPLFVNEAILPPVIGDTLHEKWPHYSNRYVLSSWIDSGEPFAQLSCSDTIDLTEIVPEYWHVVKVDSLPSGFFLKLENPTDPADTMRLRFSGGVVPDSVHRARVTPVSTWWHEVRPDTSAWWHIKSWHDNGNAFLDSCDTLDMVRLRWWHVEDVAIDIAVLSGPYPQTPTMTQWGMIVLVALIIASAVYIFLRRRRVTVAA